MSSGLICACDDERHPTDPRSELGDLAIWSRCRSYALDQDEGGLCRQCVTDHHHVAPKSERDSQQAPSGRLDPRTLERLGHQLGAQPYRPTGPHHPETVKRWREASR